ncbi:MAG: hypothetical protein ABIJ97_05855 [Bacteroidota bacterium]
MKNANEQNRQFHIHPEFITHSVMMRQRCEIVGFEFADPDSYHEKNSEFSEKRLFGVHSINNL